MGISRVDKLVLENKGFKSLQEAEQARDLPFSIVLAPGASERLGLMCLTAASLAFRCLKGPVKVYLNDSDGSSLSFYGVSLRSALLNEAEISGANSRLEFRSDQIKPGPTLALGLSIDGAVTADAAGWVAAINRVLEIDAPATSPAAVFAVCCSFAKLFNAWVLGNSNSFNESWTFSLLDFTKNPTDQRHFAFPTVNLGTVGLLGAGAIGSGFAYTLRYSGWSANVDILDFDDYDEPNLETTMLLSRKNALEKKEKATTLSDSLAYHPHIKANPACTIIAKDSQELLKPRNIFVCAVDNAETRQILDHTNAEIILNGAVGGTAEDSGHVLCSRHLAGDLPLSTLYSNYTVSSNTSKYHPREITDECSQIAYDDVTMAAPFIGLAAGALLAARSAQWATGGLTNENYIKLDLLNLQQMYRLESKQLKDNP